MLLMANAYLFNGDGFKYVSLQLYQSLPCQNEID